MEGKEAEFMDDRFLVEQSAQGNPKVFKILVLRYQRMVFFYLKNFPFPEQVREDLAQETFLMRKERSGGLRYEEHGRIEQGPYAAGI